ncbi:MAG TPA: hypothetical protein VGP07_16805 [Polyangia bacterium]|jgi:hypothetical protein
MRKPTTSWLWFVPLAFAAACTAAAGTGSNDAGSGGEASGGRTSGGSGGTSGTGGRASTGGASGAATGGTTATASGGTAPGSGGRGTGGTTASGGTTATASGGAPATASGGTTATGSGGVGGAPSGGACTGALADRLRVTEIDVGVSYAYNEVDNNGAGLGLTPLAISPLPGGGSRLAFLGKSDSAVHIVTLDTADQVVAGSAFTLPAYDFQDIYADASGGTVLVGRNAMGSTDNHNCGDINNLCGLVASYPTAASCYDMYMVRFDGSTETWATKLTETTPTLPAYGTGPTGGGNVIYIWSEYAHNGRIAFDGTNYAGYFGAAITVPGQACVGSSTLSNGVNIHQGDRMKVVNGAGALQTSGFDWGCSHSGYERVLWDPTAKKFIAVCKNDAATGSKSGRVAFAPGATTIYPVDLSYSQLGSVALAGGGGYWVVSSDIRAGQPTGANGLADVHLLHVPSATTPTPDHDLVLASDGQNDRAPHLAAYGSGQFLAAWESSTTTGDFPQNDSKRQMFVQLIDGTTGGAPAGSTTTSAGPVKVTPNVLGSRYQDFRGYPDGSVAYPAPGSSATKLQILRVLGCNE